MTAAIIILALVTLQRLGELIIARRNTRILLARGAYEAAPGHYPLIVAVHALWLAALWWYAPGRGVNWLFLAVFLILQAGRIWILLTLGGRWTTRIIVLPGSPLIRTGPYRFLRHPNYAIVIGEIAILPLAFGLGWIALVFTAINAAVLAIRISAEEKAAAPSLPVSPPPRRRSP